MTEQTIPVSTLSPVWAELGRLPCQESHRTQERQCPSIELAYKRSWPTKSPSLKLPARHQKLKFLKTEHLLKPRKDLATCKKVDIMIIILCSYTMCSNSTVGKKALTWESDLGLSCRAPTSQMCDSGKIFNFSKFPFRIYIPRLKIPTFEDLCED